MEQQFVRSDNGPLVLVATSVGALFEQLDQYHAPPPVKKWIDRAST
jgi:hypothetical protein